MSEDIRSAARSGFSHYLKKPQGVTQLVPLLSSLVGRARRA
jgi:hypothetical protein